jgi:DNA ligase-associated metallophosphoesterase
VRHEHEITVATALLVADPAGVLYWPHHALLVVADLHLEKGSSFACRGVLLPPYDSRTTLARLGGAIARYRPRIVVALGDSFHDGGAALRLGGEERALLGELQRGRDWVWISGNHDPTPCTTVGGRAAASLTLGPLTFRHVPAPTPACGEIAGHLHPLARIVRRGRAVNRRCFVADARRLIMPAFGAYAGGLNIRDGAFAGLFDPRGCTAHLLGTERLYAVAAARCVPD